MGLSLGFDIMTVNWDDAAEKVTQNKTDNITKGMMETFNLKIQQVKSELLKINSTKKKNAIAVRLPTR
jgi:hypothetical protein